MNRLQSKLLAKYGGTINDVLTDALDNLYWGEVPDPKHHAPGLLEAGRPIEIWDDQAGERVKLTREAYMDALVERAVAALMEAWGVEDSDVILQSAVFGSARYYE